MKKITCLDCEMEFVAETPKDAQTKMMPHYMESHKDIMDAGTDENKKKWMEDFDKKWNEAEEV